jgi:hypothetical protein
MALADKVRVALIEGLFLFRTNWQTAVEDAQDRNAAA